MKSFKEIYGTSAEWQIRALIDVARGKHPLEFKIDYPGTVEEPTILLAQSKPGNLRAASEHHAENVLIIMSDLAHGRARMDMLRFKDD